MDFYWTRLSRTEICISEGADEKVAWGGVCVCEKHSLGRGRGLDAGCTGGLLWNGHSGRGLRRPDWGSANRMFLC